MRPSFPNRATLLRTAYSADDEGQRVETRVVLDSDVPCTVQEATPALLETLGTLGAQAQYVVYFGSPPGLQTNDQVVQTDTNPARTLTVIGVEDRGGLGYLWLAACRARE